MGSARLLPLVLGATLFATGAADDLRILRHSPDPDGSPTSIILVTFDRPVSENLEHAPDPRSILRIEPPVPGHTEWRDPVTLRFTPDSLLATK